MRIVWNILIASAYFAVSCTDSTAERTIEGHWHAVKIIENDGVVEHQLPKGIHLNFDYPNYNFEGQISEAGNYYIRRDKLHLIPGNEELERDIAILKLSPDSLTLQMIDSLGTRSVQFLKGNH